MCRAESRLKRPEFPWITGFQNFRCFAESKNITIALPDSKGVTELHSGQMNLLKVIILYRTKNRHTYVFLKTLKGYIGLADAYVNPSTCHRLECVYLPTYAL